MKSLVILMICSVTMVNAGPPRSGVRQNGLMNGIQHRLINMETKIAYICNKLMDLFRRITMLEAAHAKVIILSICSTYKKFKKMHYFSYPSLSQKSQIQYALMGMAT